MGVPQDERDQIITIPPHETELSRAVDEAIPKVFLGVLFVIWCLLCAIFVAGIMGGAV